MTPIRRGFALIITPPASRSEQELRDLIHAMLRRLPAPASANFEPNLWLDAEAGIAIGIPAEAESAAALSVLRVLPRGVTFAAAGMHGRLRALRDLVPGGADLSSAEVLCHAVNSLSPPELFARIEEPLALAVWNGRERSLIVGRDRIGHVPVFYGRVGRDLVISTHLNAFDGHPDFQGEIDTGALAGLLRHRTAPIPSTIFRGVKQLFAGSMLVVDAGGDEIRVETKPYWSLRDAHRAALSDRSQASPAEISRELQQRITDAINRSFTDPTAPVGVFFSAGVDSNLIAAVASTTSHPLHTITTRFENGDSDEGPAAGAMAERLGATHTTLTISPEQLTRAIELAPAVHGQPHGDQAGLAAILMAEAAGTPLIMTGDAGNDLLGSNKNLAKIIPLLSLKDAIPGGLQRPLSLLAGGTAQVVEVFEGAINRFAPGSRAARLRAANLYRIAAILGADEPELLYRVRSSLIVSPERYLSGPVTEALSSYSDRTRWLDTGDRYDRWRHVELSHASIEVEGSKHEGAVTAAGAGYRAMLLDSNVLPFALRIPDSVRMNDGLDRWASIDIVRRIVGDPAMMPIAGGFGVPTNKWLRNELRPWAESLLSESNLRSTGIFDAKTVRLEWSQHLSGLHDRRYALWPVLMTLSWLETRNKRSL